MANNTIIRVPSPRFGIGEIVYLRESALLGFLEPLKIHRTSFNPDLGKTFYLFVFKRNPPNNQIAGDAIDLKGSKSISLIEDDIISFEEALSIKLRSLESEVKKTKKQVVDNFGSPDIDVEEETTSVTEPLDFGDVTVGDAKQRDYTITNNGSSDLILNDSVRSLGDDDFTIDSQSDLIISPGGSSKFVVRFAPSAIGRRVGVIQIVSNDPDENPLTFSVEGTGV